MAKTLYTDEEINKFYQELFIEKKKTKELSESLQKQTQEIEQLKKELGESKQKPDPQIKKLLAFYKSKYEKSLEYGKEEKEDEITCLMEQMETLKSLYQNSQQQIQSLKTENDILKQLPLQKDRIEDLQSENRELIQKKTELEGKLPELLELRKIYQQSLKRIKEDESCKYELERKIRNLELELGEVKKGYQQALTTIQNHAESTRALREQENELTTKLQQFDALTSALANTKSQMEELHQQLEDTRLQNHKEKQKIEKLALLIKERDRRIGALQQIEISQRKTKETNHELEKALGNAHAEHSLILEEKKKMEEELIESRRHAGQLERVIQFLRERSQEAQLELKQLREEYQNAQEYNKQLNEQVHGSNVDNLKYQEALKKEEQHKIDAQAEIDALHTQFESLRQQLQYTHQELNVVIEQNNKLNEEKQHVEAQLNDKVKIIEIFEKELTLIKQTLIRAIKEAKEIEANYHDTVKEKVTAIAKLHQVQQYIETHREQERALKGRLDHTLAQLNTTEKENRDLTDQLKTAEIENRSRDEMLLNFKREAGDRQAQVEQKNHEIANMRAQLSELEGEVRKAQQHLAKKVKELTLLEDKQQQQYHIHTELQKNIAQSNVRIAELQMALDLQIQQQKRLEEQLQETFKAAELQQNKWEQKYFALYERWQAADVRSKELEKLEEKYKQLQNLLSNLGSIMGEQSGFTSLKELPKDIPKQELNEPREIKKPYQNLFDLPKPPSRPKQDLLQ